MFSFQRSFSSDVSPAMQAMMSNMAIQQLQMIVPLIRLTDDDIQQYVIFHSSAADSVSSDNSFTSACDAVVDGAEVGIDDDEVLESHRFTFKKTDILSFCTDTKLRISGRIRLLSTCIGFSA